MALVDAMNEVGRRLESRRNALTAARGARRRDALRGALVHDLDRLSNLVSLAEGVPATALDPATFDELDGAVRVLRARMKHVGMEMAIERLNELHTSAREWMLSGTHPLGKSLHLRAEFVRYLAYLRSMSDTLSRTESDMLLDAVEAINALIRHDRHSTWLRSFADDAPLALIDPALAEFPVAEDGS